MTDKPDTSILRAQMVCSLIATALHTHNNCATRKILMKDLPVITNSEFNTCMGYLIEAKLVQEAAGGIYILLA